MKTMSQLFAVHCPYINLKKWHVY